MKSIYGVLKVRLNEHESAKWVAKVVSIPPPIRILLLLALTNERAWLVCLEALNEIQL